MRMPWSPKPLPPAPKPLLPNIPLPGGVLGAVAFGFLSAVGAGAAQLLWDKLAKATAPKQAQQAQQAQQPQPPQYARPGA